MGASMSTLQATTLEEAIRQSGEGWLIDWHVPKEGAMGHIRKAIDQAYGRARDRLGASAPNLSEQSIVAEYNRNPQRVGGFFQALAGTRTPDMLLMAWRILEGMEIKEVQLAYRQREMFHVRVVLQSPYDGSQDAPYESSNIHDFALLRHFTVGESGGRPVFDGFYALRVAD